MSVPLQAVNCGVGSEIRHPRAPGLTTVLSGQVPALIVIISYIGPRVADNCEVSDQTTLSRHYHNRVIANLGKVVHG